MTLYIGKSKNKELIVEIESNKDSKGRRESIIFNKDDANTAIELIKFLSLHSDFEFDKVVNDTNIKL